MAYSWRHQGLGLSYDNDEQQQTQTDTASFSVPSLSRLLRSDQPDHLSRRHSSVDESLYSSRPDSLQQLARRPASIHSPQLLQHQDEWSINALGISPDLEIRDLDQ